jgi:hypothetical protein
MKIREVHFYDHGQTVAIMDINHDTPAADVGIVIREHEKDGHTWEYRDPTPAPCKTCLDRLMKHHAGNAFHIMTPAPAALPRGSARRPGKRTAIAECR